MSEGTSKREIFIPINHPDPKDVLRNQTNQLNKEKNDVKTQTVPKTPRP